MPISARSRLRLTVATLALIAAGGAALAETQPRLRGIDDGASLAGSYLAGRSADIARDIGAAVKFYSSALTADPGNAGLTERVVLLSLANGEMDLAFRLSEKLIMMDANNPPARLALAVQAAKAHQFGVARDQLEKMAFADLATLTSGLMQAWIEFGEGKTDAAIKTIGSLNGPIWYSIFKNYHTAIILDAAGKTDLALADIKVAYRSDATALRVVDGYARIQARAGNKDEAIRALVAFGGENPLHPVVRELLDEIRSGKKPAPTAATVDAGIAEALYGLGSAIGLDEGPELPAAYLRLAAYLDPKAQLITMAIGDVFQGVQRCDEAIAVYETVPHTNALRRNADIQIANCLVTLDRHNEAIIALKRVVDANPEDMEAAVELGNVYRSDERFVEAAEAYTKGLDVMPGKESKDWRIYYFRGVSYERSKRWDDAEADLQKALAINPEQPQVLNYLGYSWVDRSQNLTEALELIKKAVDLRPNDGYIVDSLGWAYYRLGRYDEAVKALESAVERQAEDPVVNDHLGDAYWKVGRKREATFQWAHARDLEPTKDELPKILAKLEHGLDGAFNSNSIRVLDGESLRDVARRVYGDANQYELILEANKDRINDPNRLNPGMTLDIPERKAN